MQWGRRFGAFFGAPRRALLLPLVSAVLLATAVSPATADSGDLRARAFVRNGINRILEILKNRQDGPDEKLGKLRSAFRIYFDHQTIGGFAAGSYFKNAGAAERAHYLKALEDYVVTVYGRRMIHYSRQMDLRLKARDLIKITGTTRDGKHDVIVHSHINRRYLEPVTIDWRLRHRGNKLQIVDIIVLGISQALIYRSEFRSVIAKNGNGLKGLTDALIEKQKTLLKSAKSD
jgi:phospholipid transport system substrate-binding protein